MSECRICNRTFKYDKKLGHNKTRCNTCIVNARRKRISEMCFAYKGNKCIYCGYDRCKRSLCFHHVDPKEKDFQISGNWGLKWDRIQKELDKCILVCSNCHGEIHEGLLKVE